MAKKTSDNAGYTGYGEAGAAEIHDILAAARPADVPVMILGDPGTGKSAMVHDYAIKATGGPAVTLLLSTMDPTDISGLPTRGETERDGYTVALTEYGMPWWQDALLKGHYKDGTPCGILFIDEITNCSPALQASILELINNRILPCGEKLPTNGKVQIILCANPESSATDYNALAAPFSNRILQVSYKPTDEEFYEGFSGGWYSEEQQATWSANERAWRNRIVDFNKHTNGAFILMMNRLADGAIESEAPAYLQPDSENSDSEREILTSAWCSPRSWELSAKVLGNLGFDKEITPIQDRVLAGLVGRQAAVELATYVHQHTQIDPFSLIKHPEMQEWRVSDAEGATYNDILELARAINEAVPKCDGQDGRPTVVEALDFYEKVLELGGGAHFMTTFCQSKEIGGHYFKNIPIPEGYDRKTWTARINGILKAYRNANLIPDNARSTATVGQ